MELYQDSFSVKIQKFDYFYRLINLRKSIVKVRLSVVNVVFEYVMILA